MLWDSASNDVPQSTFQRHLGRTLPCRFEPVFEVFDSDPTFDLRLVDGHDNARRNAIMVFAPVVLPKNAQCLGDRLVEALRGDPYARRLAYRGMKLCMFGPP
jgi:hypothetical protein